MYCVLLLCNIPQCADESTDSSVRFAHQRHLISNLQKRGGAQAESPLPLHVHVFLHGDGTQDRGTPGHTPSFLLRWHTLSMFTQKFVPKFPQRLPSTPRYLFLWIQYWALADYNVNYYITLTLAITIIMIMLWKLGTTTNWIARKQLYSGYYTPYPILRV